MKTAIITGFNGQDGNYLANLLINKNYNVVGTYRRSSRDLFKKKLIHPNLHKVKLEPCELTEFSNIYNLIKKYKPDEIYNLGAQSFVKESFSSPISTTNINSLSVLYFLETVRLISKKTKFYQASTSEMYGNTHDNKYLNEESKFEPRSPYGASKLYSHNLVKIYRNSYGLFACSGILFNHESPLRGNEFVTRKITNSFAKISLGIQKKISLGNLEAKRDWGHAEDYVEAMYLMMQQKKSEDFVIATGKSYTVKKFVELAANYFGYKINWKGNGVSTKGYDINSGKLLVDIDKKYFRPYDVENLLGSSEKARLKLKWKPKKNINDIVKEMCEYDLALLKNAK